MITKKEVLAVERLAKRHRQLLKLKYRTEAEEIEIKVVGEFLRSVEERMGHINERVAQLEARLSRYGIRLTDHGIERLH
jgi:hypothetical protein